jgi:hypothetical protein
MICHTSLTSLRKVLTRFHDALTAEQPRGSDSGSAMLMAVVATVAAAGIGLIAVTAVTRSVTNEERLRNQNEVNLLAASAAEEAFGRIGRDREGLLEITGRTASPAIAAHPGYGADPDTTSGPWVRFNEYGQVVPCRADGESSEIDARLACFTIRLGASPDLDTASTALIDVTARQCRNADPLVSTCVYGRIQTTLLARSFAEHLISVENAFSPTADDTLSGTTQITSDLPSPTAADFQGIAGLVLPSSSLRIGVDLTVSTSSEAGVTETTSSLPVNGVIYVDGDLEIEEIAAVTPLTIAASGTVTIAGDVLSAGMVTIISTDGVIEIATTAEGERRITAVLIATSTSAGTGIIRTTFGDGGSITSESSTSVLVLSGAVLARTLGPFTDTVTPDGGEDPVLVGYRLQWTFDENLRVEQSPFGILQVRGRWIRVDQVSVFPT